MSGEFGDNVSISSRRKSIVVTEEEIVRIIIIINFKNIIVIKKGFKIKLKIYFDK